MLDTMITEGKDYSIDKLMQWVNANGGVCPNIKIHQGCERYGVYCDKHIKNSDSVIRIPLKLCITVESAINYSEICRRLEIEDINEDGLALSNINQNYLAIYILEGMNDEKCFHWPYFKLLPTTLDHIPLFWKDEELLHLKESRGNLLNKLESRRVTLREDYEHVCEIVPEMSRFSFDRYIYAMGLVASRNFSVDIDGEKSIVMVPVADMLNHKRPRMTKWEYKQKNGNFVITALQSLTPGCEVFDSYGKKCNSRFLLNYGFVIAKNWEYDPKKLHAGSCYNEFPLKLSLDETDVGINVKKNLWDRYDDFDSYCSSSLRISMDWNDCCSREALSLTRFRCAKPRELLQLPIITYEVDLKSRVIPPLSISSECEVLKHIATCMGNNNSSSISSCRGISGILFDYDQSIEEAMKIENVNIRNAKVFLLGERLICNYWICMSIIFTDFYADIESLIDTYATRDAVHTKDVVNGKLKALKANILAINECACSQQLYVKVMIDSLNRYINDAIVDLLLKPYT